LSLERSVSDDDDTWKAMNVTKNTKIVIFQKDYDHQSFVQKHNSKSDMCRRKRLFRLPLFSGQKPHELNYEQCILQTNYDTDRAITGKAFRTAPVQLQDPPIEQ